MAQIGPVRSALQWCGLRSEYAMLPAMGGGTVTGTHQIGIAFSGHRRTVRQFEQRTVR